MSGEADRLAFIADSPTTTPAVITLCLSDRRLRALASDDPGLPADDISDPVLSAAWNHRSTVEVSVALSGGGPVERRRFALLTGAP